ncbi:hypothetical protein GGS23DRAFT_560189 [Durotheca rogersii]|uniref:uncharacterized protein n=1 Tax=Durotheca rogersii TaxID=419775 RepID=UPI00221F4F5A|nr:uncharacterized protein GGS23DRAFT_560189 [Durotheca rogersii]KAI5865661.1 hypothetical protein GGS23DRAFT_560189 [Durotheca rogersii]
MRTFPTITASCLAVPGVVAGPYPRAMKIPEAGCWHGFIWCYIHEPGTASSEINTSLFIVVSFGLINATSSNPTIHSIRCP